MSAEGINDELMPLLRMTVPRGLDGLDLRRARAAARSGAAGCLLFGLIPFDYDDLGLERIEPSRGFLERSTMLSQRSGSTSGRSSRSGGSCRHRPVAWEPRCRCRGSAAVIGVFRHRHRRLRRTSAALRAARLAAWPSPMTSQALESLPPTGPTSSSTCGSTTRAVRRRRSAEPGQRAAYSSRLALAALVAHSFGHAAAAETVKGVLAKLDARRRRRRDAGARGARGPRRGRADVGPAGERPRGVPPAPLALGVARVARSSRRPRPDARQPGRGDAERRRPRGRARPRSEERLRRPT